MPNYEKQIFGMQLEYVQVRRAIQNETNSIIFSLNRALDRVVNLEAREAIMAEKRRVMDAARNSLRYLRTNYQQQVELLREQYYAENRRRRNHAQRGHLCKTLRELAADDSEPPADLFSPADCPEVDFS